MGRLIDADALLTERKMSKYYHLPNGDIAIPIIDIEHAPTIHPEPPKRGRWVQDESFVWVWHCSECGKRTTETVMGKPMYKFCPMCGAKMEGNDGNG